MTHPNDLLAFYLHHIELGHRKEKRILRRIKGAVASLNRCRDRLRKDRQGYADALAALLDPPTVAKSKSPPVPD